MVVKLSMNRSSLMMSGSLPLTSSFVSDLLIQGSYSSFIDHSMTLFGFP